LWNYIIISLNNVTDEDTKMAHYGTRIASLKAEQERLAQLQSDLAARRRAEIGKLAERLGVLETEDELLAAVFMELKGAIASNSPRLAQWRDAGSQFRSTKSQRRRGANATQNPNGARPDRDAEGSNDRLRTKS
jgi:hypothetical protein